MSPEKFLIMRHELLLTVAALMVLIVEVFSHPHKKGKVITLSAICFGIITVLGFLPSPDG